MSKGPLPSAIALDDGVRTWRFDALDEEVGRVAGDFRRAGLRVLATLMDNGPAWVVADRAAALAGLVHVPLPGFFTQAQLGHAISVSGADGLLTATAVASQWPGGPGTALAVAGESLKLVRLPGGATPMPAGTAKVTFTSGTTGSPKGVCLDAGAMGAVAQGLVEALRPLDIRRHLCALPLAVLLENIAGLDAPLAHGATCVVPPLGQLGLSGSSSFDAAKFHEAVCRHQPDSVVLLPQMLRAWLGHLLQSGTQAPACLKLVAVGGAAVGAPLIEAARAHGIPAYEGYGLSEGASVQTLNLPGADRPGSAGRVLPHARLRIAADGEIEVAGSLFLGYLGDSGTTAHWWPTGDLGRLDADGFLHVEGRKKNVLITSFGRNVSPEWVETALATTPEVAQAVVFGDAQPALSAVLWPLRGQQCTDDRMQAAVDTANQSLPDYARVRHWVRARAAFTPETGLATSNGRPRREAILRAHPDVIAQAPMNFHDRLLEQTASARADLLQVPIIQACLRGEVSLSSYLAFLREAFHHVRHTVPLLAACKASMPARNAWLDAPLAEYIEEEQGHDQWILADIDASGGSSREVREGAPGHATEVMVAYAYDTIARRNPVGFFGMVHVLEGTSVSLALLAADRIQERLGLPDAAFSYLRSHGTLDQEHTAHFAMLMDQITDPGDQQDIIHAARAFYRLYGDVFRSLPLPVAPRSAETAP